MNQTNGALAGLSPEELRTAVREVLREVLPAGMVSEPGDTQRPAPSGGPSGQLPALSDVVISTDADLTAFVRRIAVECESAQQRAALQDGRHGFRLASRVDAGPAGVGSQGPGDTAAPVTRIDRGAVTERAVLRAAAEGARLLLGRRAVMTPLARDKARSLGVEIGKEY